MVLCMVGVVDVEEQRTTLTTHSTIHRATERNGSVTNPVHNCTSPIMKTSLATNTSNSLQKIISISTTHPTVAGYKHPKTRIKTRTAAS